MISLIYLDSCIGIYYIERRNPWYGAIQASLQALAAERVAVSDLVRLECRVLPVRVGDSELLARYDAFFRRLRTLPLTPEGYDRATSLRALHNLSTPDAIHLGAAIEHGCAEFWTNDHRLDHVVSEVMIRSFPKGSAGIGPLI